MNGYNILSMYYDLDPGGACIELYNAYAMSRVKDCIDSFFFFFFFKEKRVRRGLDYHDR